MKLVYTVPTRSGPLERIVIPTLRACHRPPRKAATHDRKKATVTSGRTNGSAALGSLTQSSTNSKPLNTVGGCVSKYTSIFAVGQFAKSSGLAFKCASEVTNSVRASTLSKLSSMAIKVVRTNRERKIVSQ
jgi:hypothetical protein